MRKIMMVFVLIPVSIYAAYNPFFRGETPPQPQIKQQEQVKKVIVYQKPPARKTIEMTYYGFVESNKGLFALVEFDKKNIVIRQNDSLYLDEQRYKVKKITSNYILLKDKRGRTEAVYFSTQKSQSI